MNCLIIYSHFNPESFNHALVEVLTETLSKSHHVKIRDLYALSFNPVLTKQDMDGLERGAPPSDIQTEQELVRWADTLFFVFPIWWSSMPAIMKGYIDRIFSFGFAYMADEKGAQGLLQGKKVYLVNTTGADEDTNNRYGVFQSMQNLVDVGIFQFCGMEVVGHQYFAAVQHVSAEERTVMISKFRSAVERFGAH